jgi:K+-sensing histidine kinase KdpD
MFYRNADNGCGISKENLAKVKERFYRVDSARTKETGAAALGIHRQCNVGLLGGELVIKVTWAEKPFRLFCRENIKFHQKLMWLFLL